MPTISKPKLYNPRHPECTLLYQTVAEHHETWLDLASAGQIDGQGDHHSPKPCVRKAFAKYLECGLNEHVHFHVCAVDGVLEEVAGEGEGDADDEARAQARSTSVIFHPATGVNADAVGQAQASLRSRILRAFVGRGLLEGFEAKEMMG